MEHRLEIPRDKTEKIALWKRGVKGLRQYCMDENISFHLLQYWDRKIRKQNTTSKFVKLKTIASIFEDKNYCELIFTNGNRIVFNQKPEASFVKQLLV